MSSYSIKDPRLAHLLEWVEKNSNFWLFESPFQIFSHSTFSSRSTLVVATFTIFSWVIFSWLALAHDQCNLTWVRKSSPKGRINNRDQLHQLAFVLFPCLEPSLQHGLLKTLLNPRPINILFVCFSCHALCIKYFMMYTQKKNPMDKQYVDN